MSSMGPYSESTEYGHPGVVRVLNDELQWGRTLRARNTATAAKAATEMTELQWGRTLRARNTIAKGLNGSLAQAELQWGRALRARNTGVCPDGRFKRDGLQWGRALRARNTPASRRRAAKQSSFNGAVL